MDIYSREYHRKIAEEIAELLEEELGGKAFLDGLLCRFKRDGSEITTLLIAASRTAKHRIGGQAFREWNAGLYRDGVWVHTSDHKFGVGYAPSPLCRVKSGCQDSCAHGDSTPRLYLNDEKVRWIGRDKLPKSALTDVDFTARELFVEAVRAVLKTCDRWDVEFEKRREAREAEQAEIESAWGG